MYETLDSRFRGNDIIIVVMPAKAGIQAMLQHAIHPNENRSKLSPIVIPFGVGHHPFMARGVTRYRCTDGVARKVKLKVCTAFLS